MTEHVIKLPDVGEGIAEAELVEWLVKIGDFVREDTPLGAVMTDKATVEIPSPVEGQVVWLAGKVGDVLAIGSDFVRLGVDGKTMPSAEAKPSAPQPTGAPARDAVEVIVAQSFDADGVMPSPHANARRCGSAPAAPTGEPGKAASCARGSIARARGRRRSAPGAWLRLRPDGSPMTISTLISRGQSPGQPRRAIRQERSVEDIKIIGLRRKIAEKMALASSRIPHITYVDEVDVTALEELRAKLNGSAAGQTEAHSAAVPDARDGAGDRKAAQSERALR